MEKFHKRILVMPWALTRFRRHRCSRYRGVHCAPRISAPDVSASRETRKIWPLWDAKFSRWYEISERTPTREKDLILSETREIGAADERKGWYHPHNAMQARWSGSNIACRVPCRFVGEESPLNPRPTERPLAPGHLDIACFIGAWHQFFFLSDIEISSWKKKNYSRQII